MPSRAYERALEGAARVTLRRGDALWPSAIDSLEDVDTLFVVGDPEAMSGECLSVIGARRATPYGLACARLAARVAAECGITVVSGGAMGCDQAAGREAIAAGGPTVVVSGCGADRCYPRSSDTLFADAVTHGGCVVALEHWGAPPRRYAFPRRNRVIAALSRALVVCEAGMPSGTFSTATCAAELGRLVYAVPGPIFSPNSRGANWLIESGASVICDEQSLETRISLDYNRLRLVGERPRRGDEGDELLRALMANPMRVDEIARELSLSIPDALMMLSRREAAGAVEQLPDGRFAPSQGLLLGGGEGPGAPRPQTCS